MIDDSIIPDGDLGGGWNWGKDGIDSELPDR